MKKYLLLLIAFTTYFTANAQTEPRRDGFYTMSGIGFVFPVGETSDYLKPKFSSTLGANIAVGNGGLFIYPKVNLFSYAFDQLVLEPGNNFLVKDGRATTYILNLNIGYRGNSGDMSYYGFVGGGGGIVLTQLGEVDPVTSQVTLSNKTNGTATMEVGGGLEYRLGTFILFTEVSYLHGFKEIQNRSFSSIPVSVGFKTDLSKLFRKK
ncbi:MAG: hypothetical protein EOO89_08380 [Pedobacter sp.]|nr:MAG: hypothetical protein EOO89_08380 [Pedobacter sp.]